MKKRKTNRTSKKQKKTFTVAEFRERYADLISASEEASKKNDEHLRQLHKNTMPLFVCKS